MENSDSAQPPKTPSPQSAPTRYSLEKFTCERWRQILRGDREPIPAAEKFLPRVNGAGAVGLRPSPRTSRSISAILDHRDSAARTRTPAGFWANTCSTEPICPCIAKPSSAPSPATQRAAQKDLALPNASRDLRWVCCSDQLSPPPDPDGMDVIARGVALAVAAALVLAVKLISKKSVLMRLNRRRLMPPFARSRILPS